MKFVLRLIEIMNNELTKQQEDYILEQERDNCSDKDNLFFDFMTDNRDRLETEFRENNEELFDNYARAEFEVWLNDR